MHVREVDDRADGCRLTGTPAVPDGSGPFPAVLIGHEGPGLDDVQRGRARNAGADLKATVGFHPGLRTVRPDDAANITGRVLMIVGADDPLIPAEHRTAFEEEMRAGAVDWQLHVYGGVRHSFTHPHASGAGVPGVADDERAATQAWSSMSDLLRQTLA